MIKNINNIVLNNGKSLEEKEAINISSKINYYIDSPRHRRSLARSTIDQTTKLSSTYPHQVYQNIIYQRTG